MTVKEFRDMMKKRDKDYNQNISLLEGQQENIKELEVQINKRLYKGIPGLSDAVISAVNDHFDKARALDQLDRRVEEQVMFGDCKAAIETLQTFEKDEIDLGDSIKLKLKAEVVKLLGAGTKTAAKKKVPKAKK